ncbi:hypothetical protein BC940DRAFT_303874 [Gongronella butleri]|nr:hypothetical protein BC940DRAFT_303874 [Gongronella butleri]
MLRSICRICRLNLLSALASSRTCTWMATSRYGNSWSRFHSFLINNVIFLVIQSLNTIHDKGTRARDICTASNATWKLLFSE